MQVRLLLQASTQSGRRMLRQADGLTIEPIAHGECYEALL